MIKGLLLIDKPEGPSSNFIVGQIRRRLGRSVKVGHTGTLDPCASGLLVVLVGTATRVLDYLDEKRKNYRARIRLGEESDTCDREGKIVVLGDVSGITPESIESCLKGFLGKTDQIPPNYSAIKINGVPLYKLARRGLFPSVEKRTIEIFRLSLLEWTAPDLEIDVECSKGTYVRSLARDIGIALGTGGRLETLRRISSGRFHVDAAHDPESIVKASDEEILKYLTPLYEALEHIPQIKTSFDDLRKLASGARVVIEETESLMKMGMLDDPNTIYRVHDCQGRIIILARVEKTPNTLLLRPTRVFNSGCEFTGEIKDAH
ncbi:MAG: tRNA pseudouridine(55) synthase TruB [Desulfomonilaceae bacterium]